MVIICIIHTIGERHYFVKWVKFTIFLSKIQIVLPLPKEWTQSRNSYDRMSTRMDMFDFDTNLKITTKFFVQWFSQFYRAHLLSWSRSTQKIRKWQNSLKTYTRRHVCRRGMMLRISWPRHIGQKSYIAIYRFLT